MCKGNRIRTQKKTVLERFEEAAINFCERWIGPAIYVFGVRFLDAAFHKVGFSLDKDRRLNQWNAKYDSECIYETTVNAIIDDKKDVYVKDHAFHKYFKEHGYENLSKSDFEEMIRAVQNKKKKLPYSKEFYKLGLEWKSILQAAYADIQDDWFNNGGVKYSYYTWDPEEFTNVRVNDNYQRGENWILREEQAEVVHNLMYLLDKGETKDNKFLMSAPCRFGKTFTAYECAEAYRKRLSKKVTTILIMTAQPGSVKHEWYKNYKIPGNYKNYEFITSYIHN